MNTSKQLTAGLGIIIVLGVISYLLTLIGPGPSSVPTTATSTIATTTMSDATSTPDWGVGMTIITRADTGKTITLARDARFVIQMGSDLNWTIAFDPSGIISRVANSTTADGIQGVYSADVSGTTTLHATGAPICKPGYACPQFLVAVPVTIVVQ